MIWCKAKRDIDNGAGPIHGLWHEFDSVHPGRAADICHNQPYGSNLPFFFSRISAQQTYLFTSSRCEPFKFTCGCAPLRMTLRQTCPVPTCSCWTLMAHNFSTLTPYASPGLHFDTAASGRWAQLSRKQSENACASAGCSSCKIRGRLEPQLPGVTGTVQGWRGERVDRSVDTVDDLILNSLGGL